MIRTFDRAGLNADNIKGFYGFLEIPDRQESARVEGQFCPRRGAGHFEYTVPLENPARLERTAYAAGTLYIGSHAQRVHNICLKKSELLPGDIQRLVYTFEFTRA